MQISTIHTVCFNTQETACAIAKPEKGMDEIEKWITVNKLQLNAEKTDFVITGSKSLLDKPPCKTSGCNI